LASDKQRRLIVLGAGASGLPDAATVIPQLFYYCRGPIPPIRNRGPFALFDPLAPSLIEAMRSTGILQGSRWPLDAICEWFGSRVKQDPSTFPTFALLYEAIAQFLYVRSCERAESYRTFVQALRPGDIIVTLNWDICVEIALHAAQLDFYRQMRLPPKDRPSIFKPHGSVDFLIVETSNRDPDSHTAQYHSLPDYVEALDAQLPTLFSSGNISRHHLFRLRTYDLNHRISTRWDPDTLAAEIEMEAENAVLDPTLPDLGVFYLKNALGSPTYFLLTPGLSDLFYDWSYGLRAYVLRSVAAEIRSIIVAGYSFPEYDKRFLDVLEQISNRADRPIAKIVNPAVDALPHGDIDRAFVRTEYHALRFNEFDWS
jgi:hypothetical protein